MKHRKLIMDQRRMWSTEGIVLESVNIGHSDDADADEEEEAFQADDGSTQNVEDQGHSTSECEDWTVYFRPLKYENNKANAMASNVSGTRSVL